MTMLMIGMLAVMLMMMVMKRGHFLFREDVHEKSSAMCNGPPWAWHGGYSPPRVRNFHSWGQQDFNARGAHGSFHSGVG